MARATKAAFPASRPRAEKTRTGRAGVEHTPLAIRTTGLSASPELRDHVRASLGAKLSKHAEHIERVSVRFEDVNGPRGGVDIVCRVKVVLSNLPSVLVDAKSESKRPAFDAAAGAVSRAVRRSIERVTTKARKTPGPAKKAPRASSRS